MHLSPVHKGSTPRATEVPMDLSPRNSALIRPPRLLPFPRFQRVLARLVSRPRQLRRALLVPPHHLPLDLAHQLRDRAPSSRALHPRPDPVSPAALLQQIDPAAARVRVAVPLRVLLRRPDARARVHEQQQRHGERGGGRDDRPRVDAAAREGRLARGGCCGGGAGRDGLGCAVGAEGFGETAAHDRQCALMERKRTTGRAGGATTSTRGCPLGVFVVRYPVANGGTRGKVR
nr:hypothetical protein CFP56_52442 [Quercus suber]